MATSNIILVIYINIGRMDIIQAQRYCNAIKRNIQDRTEDYTVFYVLVRTGETRVECINPVMMDKKTYDTTVTRVLTEYQLRVDEFIESSQKKVKAATKTLTITPKSTPKPTTKRKP